MSKIKDQLNTDFLEESGSLKYTLSLYVTGASSNSVKAIANISKICETHLKGNYDLEIIDIYQQPNEAAKEQVIAIPMLIKRAPLPQKRLIGDMSNTNKVLVGLGIKV